jgi:hypothetical protein
VSLRVSNCHVGRRTEYWGGQYEVCSVRLTQAPCPVGAVCSSLVNIIPKHQHSQRCDVLILSETRSVKCKPPVSRHTKLCAVGSDAWGAACAYAPAEHVWHVCQLAVAVCYLLLCGCRGPGLFNSC